MNTACVATPPLVIEDGQDLAKWQVWPAAWGGVARLSQEPAGPAGAPAIRLHAPGIAYRLLPPASPAEARAWNAAPGVAVWVQGDGSELYGCLALGPAQDGSWQHGFANAKNTGYAAWFSLRERGWRQLTLPWSAFLPEGPHPAIGAPGGPLPADLRVLRLGHRWKYARNYDTYPAHSYALGPVTLLPAPATAPPSAPPPPLAAAPLAPVLAKMRAGEAVRILCLGDSITAGAGSTPDQRYWVLLEPALRQHFQNPRITVAGWGIGGATLLDARHWLAWQFDPTPPDLVTLAFGTNDSNAYPAEHLNTVLAAYLPDAVRLSAGRSAILPMTTLPGLGDWWTKTEPQAAAFRAAAAAHCLPCFDLHQAMREQGQEALKPAFADGVHLSAAGHQEVARLLFAWLVQQAQAEVPTP